MTKASWLANTPQYFATAKEDEQLQKLLDSYIDSLTEDQLEAVFDGAKMKLDGAQAILDSIERRRKD